MLPEDVKYGRSHCWSRVEGDVATIGVTAEALKPLGNLVTIELPDPGDDVLHDVPVAEIEGTRDACDVFSLVDGLVTEINGKAAHDPELISRDPYGQGWLVRIRITENSRQDELLTVAEYKALVGRKR